MHWCHLIFLSHDFVTSQLQLLIAHYVPKLFSFKVQKLCMCDVICLELKKHLHHPSNLSAVFIDIKGFFLLESLTHTRYISKVLEVLMLFEHHCGWFTQWWFIKPSSITVLIQTMTKTTQRNIKQQDEITAPLWRLDFRVRGSLTARLHPSAYKHTPLWHGLSDTTSNPNRTLGVVAAWHPKPGRKWCKLGLVTNPVSVWGRSIGAW